MTNAENREGNLIKKQKPKKQSADLFGARYLIQTKQNYSMINVYIKAPIWKTKSIGVNKRIIKDDLLIEITYLQADGSRLYPHTYYMRKDIALRYPTQKVAGGMTLHIIPIYDLVVLTRDQIDYAQYCQSERIPFRLMTNEPPQPIKEAEPATVDVPKTPNVPEAKQQRMEWVNN